MTDHARRLILILASALALGATTAASASASEYFVEGKQVTEATNVEGTSGHSLLASKVGAVEVKVECAKDTETGTVEAGGKGSATLDLKECSVTKPANCSIPALIEGKLKSKLAGVSGSEDEFEPVTSGGAITEVTISGASCSIVGTYALTGSQTCELPEIGVEKKEHEIVCKKAGSKLKFGLEPASFSSVEMIKLVSGKTWAAFGPTAPRPEQVNFKGNRAVLIDHQKEAVEPAIKINEFEGNDEIEWKSPKPGEVKKNWPVVYVLGEKVKLEAKFAIEEVTREFLEKRTEEPLEITGETSVGGTALQFTRKFTLEEIKTQLTAHKEYLVMEAESTSLAKKALKSIATITWKWSVKETGRAKPIEQELGKSTHNFYVLYKTPLGGTEIYLTILDLDTLGVQGQGEPLNEEKVIAGVWEGFSKTEATIPTVHTRTYKPGTATGEINRTGKVLEYYGEIVKAGKTLEEVYTKEIEEKQRSTTCPSRPLALMLENFAGRCGAWGQALNNALAVEGISSQEIGLRVQFGKGQCGTQLECVMLVKNWSFGLEGVGPFPFAANEVTDEEGAPGQGVKNPPPFFWDHVIIKAGPVESEQLYDPSYGTGPFNGKENLEAGESPTEKSVLEEYQNKSISGYCAPTNLGELAARPVKCVKPAGILGLWVEGGFLFH